MGITKQYGWRIKSIFTSLVLMLACLFISRAALSMSMMLFLTLSILHKNVFTQLKSFGKNNFLMAISLLFFIPFVSGLWSSNAGEWGEIIRIKLPLVFFPVAFAGAWRFSEKQWRMLALVFLLLVFAECGWSLLHYVLHAAAFNQGYLQAKVLSTPLENDHIRFSWLVCVAIILCFLAWQLYPQKKLRIVIAALVIFFALYLHILAARMGLLCFYLFLFTFGFWLLLKSNNKKLAAISMACILLFPLAAWLALPTFQNRARYVIYDLSNVRSKQYLPGSNDGARILSIKAGWQLVKENPFGVGAGDLKPLMNEWYKFNAPQLADRFLPCSQVLVYGAFAGWLAMVLLMGILAVPFFLPMKRHRIFWYCLNAIVVFSFVFDMTIEAQFGVFIYAFVILWWWKWFGQTAMHE